MPVVKSLPKIPPKLDLEDMVMWGWEGPAFFFPGRTLETVVK